MDRSQESIKSGELEDALELDWGIKVKAEMVDVPLEAVETSVAQSGPEEASLPDWTCPV